MPPFYLFKSEHLISTGCRTFLHVANFCNRIRIARPAASYLDVRGSRRIREMASERAPSPAIERDRGKSPFEVVDRTDTSTSTHGVLSRDNWTEFIPPSDYVRFFISFDWSATALGPLYRWQIALRMHTFVLFADQRPGCLLWFVSCLSLPCLITYNNQGRRKGCHLQRSLLEFNGITYMPSWLTTSNNYARERTASEEWEANCNKVFPN
jgi:hypothetical protein